MKHFVKILIPPIIWNFVKALFVKEIHSFTYTGKYDSFEEVLMGVPLSTRYNSTDSLEYSLVAAREKFERFKSGYPPSLNWDNSRLNLFPAFLITMNFENKIRVLDIGGGLGVSFLDLKFSNPEIKTEYTVYELPEIVQLGKEFSNTYKELNFCSDFPKKSESYDVILFGSSLQYFENYQEIIESTCALKPTYIILTDHPMGVVSSFICAQVNMKDRVIPRYVFNLNEIILLFEEKNYKLIHKSVNFYPFHNFSNYEGDYQKTLHYNIVFESIRK